jgi:superfamily I DNA/RNA helicase
MHVMGELSKAQISIIEHQGSSLVMGSPGTGKTYTLIEKISKILEQGISPSEIYVVAFTYYSWQMLLGK